MPVSVFSLLCSCFFLCLDIFPLFFLFLSLCFLSPPLAFSPRTTQFFCIHKLSPFCTRGCSSASPSVICPSPAGPDVFPGDSKRWRPGPHSGAQEEGAKPATTTQRHTHTPALNFCLLPKGKRAFASHCPTPCWEMKKPSLGAGRCGRGESFGEDFLFCIFYGHI